MRVQVLVHTSIYGFYLHIQKAGGLNAEISTADL